MYIFLNFNLGSLLYINYYANEIGSLIEHATKYNFFKIIRFSSLKPVR